MTTCPLPVSPSPTLSDQQTLDLALDCLLKHFPLKTQGACQPKTLFQVLLRAASRHDSIEHTAQQLTGVPSGNGLRHHLSKFKQMGQLEQQVNQALQSRLPLSMANHRHRLAIDLNLLPYYGTPSDAAAPYLYRSQAKAGTTTFFAYATVYVIRCHQRFTLALHAVRRGETLVAVITQLLRYLNPLRLKVERLYLDRGFYSVPVIRWLQALRIPFIMPAIVRGKTGGTRALCRGKRSYQTTYELSSAAHGSVSCQMVVVCRYHKGYRGQHGVKYLLYVVYKTGVAWHQVHRHYRQRFGIEASYRLKNHCRIRSTTKNPGLRLLYVAIAFILVNLWIYLLWHYVSGQRRGRRKVYQDRFRLKTMLEFLGQAIERQFLPIRQVCLLSSE